MVKTEPEFELVHAVYDYWDQPRSGVADFKGKPHWFERIFDEKRDEYSSEFWLIPLSSKGMVLVKQQFDIFLRWREAFDRGEVDHSTHPALPQEKETFESLQLALEKELAGEAAHRFKMVGQFKILGSPAQPANISSFQVRWRPD